MTDKKLVPPSESAPLPNIFQRLNAVRKVVDYAKKDKQIGEGRMSYKAVTHDQVTAITRDALIANGIIVIPTELSSQTVPAGFNTSSGIPYVRFEAKYAYHFIRAIYWNVEAMCLWKSVC